MSQQGVGQQGPSVSRSSFGVTTRGLRRWMILCHDMTLGVIITTLQWKTKVCRDRVFSIATKCSLSRQGLVVWCRDTILVS